MKPRILFISTAIPPHPESQTIRNLFFIKSLHDVGCHLTIITAECEVVDGSLQSLMPRCHIIRTPRPRHFRIEGRLKSLPLGKYWQWLYGIYSNFWEIPDAWSGWEKDVVDTATRWLGRTAIDLIITSSGSYTAHLAGAYLKKEWGTLWVADLGDPWSKNPIWPANFFYRVWRNNRLERNSIPRADALVVTTEPTAYCYREWLGPKAPQISVIPMGYEPTEFTDVAPAVRAGIYRIAYIGVAYRTGRDLRPLMRAITGLGRYFPIHFRVIGPCSDSYFAYARRYGGDMIEFLGWVDYKQSLKYIKREDILVAIGNPGGLQIPGKLYMYLASGRPILYISQSDREDDPGRLLLQKFPGVYHCRNNSEDIESTLYNLLDNFDVISTDAFSRVASPAMAEYSWPQLGRRFGELILRVWQK